MGLKRMELTEFTPDIFQVFGKQPPLLTAGGREACNTMTIGWCQLGRLWNLPVCTVFVRPERYTYEFMERGAYFTVSVFDASYKAVLADCGRRSGRDADKIGENHLTLCYGQGDAPYFAEADWVLVCKKLYTADLKREGMLDERIPAHYETDGLHRVYVGEVKEIYHK